MDAKGTILTASSPPATLFGFKAASIVGKNIAQLIDIFGELKATPAKLTQCLEGLFVRCVPAHVHQAGGCRLHLLLPCPPARFCSQQLAHRTDLAA